MADAHHATERMSHGLYGLIIVTSALVAEQHHIDDAVEALVLLLTTGFVLLLAHTYTTYMAERAVQGAALDTMSKHLVVLDNLPVLLAIVVPGALFLLAAGGVIELTTAYSISIAFTMFTLFGLGLYAGRKAHMGWGHAIGSGLTAVIIGALVVLVEVFFE